MDGRLLRESGLRTICISNQKGGVGKTASSICLSSGLAIAGQKVLVIDGDPQGNLSLFFTKEKSFDLSDLFKEIIENGMVLSIDKYISKDVRPGLDIIPLHNRKLRTEISENQLADITFAFAKLVSQLKNTYQWILIDCSPSNGRLEKLLISSSDAALVPLEFQLFSIAGLSSLLNDIKACGQILQKDIPIEALIFIKAENRLNRVQEYRKIFSTFQLPIYEVCKSEFVPKSIEMGMTIWEMAPSSFVSKDYYKIIEKIFLG